MVHALSPAPLLVDVLHILDEKTTSLIKDTESFRIVTQYCYSIVPWRKELPSQIDQKPTEISY